MSLFIALFSCFGISFIFFSGCVVGSLESGVLAVHSEHRENAGLYSQVWYSELAKDAQDHTDALTSGSCALVHSSASVRRFKQGENLYLVGGDDHSETDLGEKASKAWYSEIKDYKYPDDPTDKWDKCVDWTKVGHFTQMMWYSSVQIGCGSGTCNGKTIVTCHYLGAGNYADTPMFSEDNYKQLVASGEKMDRCSSSTERMPSIFLIAVLSMTAALAKTLC
ncbi:uncharacterized protein LOC142335936 isoform X2 [Convolutriloba macropyga]|uniref:uncharacterized protein LOC142335936 isoform X2 n=1 Tax=Convolutriloba macropyga TaxID=536237 RepID=UPI003F522467